MGDRCAAYPRGRVALRVSPMRRSLLPIALLGLLAFVPADEPPSGFERFLTKQSDLAKAFVRKKDWAGAIDAWRKVLEMDPASLAALTGVAEGVQATGNKDGELQARYELAEALNRAVSLGQADQKRALDATLARIAELDPQEGRTEALLVDYSNAQKELAKSYELSGFPASAIGAWGRRARLVLPGSPEYLEAATAIDQIKRTGRRGRSRLGCARGARGARSRRTGVVLRSLV
jgi:tetratricopeptide (TPR) repeat protein